MFVDRTGLMVQWGATLQLHFLVFNICMPNQLYITTENNK